MNELRLMPVLTANMFVRKKHIVGVIEFSNDPNNAFLMFGTRENGDILVPVAGQWQIWQEDGTLRNARHALLAWREHEGPWHVIDSRVTPLLPQIDKEIGA